MSIAENLLPEFDREFAGTRKFLALVPDDRLAWKAHAKSMEMGRLAWHLSDLTERVVDVLTKSSRTVTAEDLMKRKDAWKGKTHEMILERFDTNLKVGRETLAGMSDSAWDDRWQLVFNGRLLIDDRRSGVYRSVIISHQVHHRAQLGLYLRLNEIAIPGVYGPSADEM
jgi:uncharacterized damage-inducible protein DinB